jgi:hypothetical protein
MPTAPTILPTHIAQGRAPGPQHRLDGELVPVLAGLVWVHGYGSVFGGRLDN